jgi:hypothetical protein
MSLLVAASDFSGLDTLELLEPSLSDLAALPVLGSDFLVVGVFAGGADVDGVFEIMRPERWDRVSRSSPSPRVRSTARAASSRLPTVGMMTSCAEYAIVYVA